MQRDSQLHSLTVALVGAHKDSSTEVSLWWYVHPFYLTLLFYFCFFSNLASAHAVTDALRGCEINGMTIPPLFGDILPTALSDSGYLLSTRTQRGSRSLKEFRKWYASVQLPKKLNALGRLPPHRFLLNNTIPVQPCTPVASKQITKKCVLFYLWTWSAQKESGIISKDAVCRKDQQLFCPSD